MRFEKILVIMQKEFDEIMKNKLVLGTILFTPLVFAVIVPMAMILPIAFAGDSFLSSNNTTVSNGGFSGLPNMSSQADIITFLVTSLLPFFMMLPAMLPIIISSYSIIGEKKNRTLEPLLAAPVSVYEIMIGKALSAMIPALLATWISTLLFFAMSETIVKTILNIWIVPDYMTWLVGMFALAPLLAFLGILITLVISSRVNDPRVAQQISVVILLPLIGIFMLQFNGLIMINTQFMFLLVVVVFIIDALALKLSNVMFDREEILTRWKS